jgi:hypothetical protein
MKWPAGLNRAWFSFSREHMQFFSAVDGSRRSEAAAPPVAAA